MYQREHEYIREQEQSLWGCSFFKQCWNEGLKRPARNNCPECCDQYLGYRQSRVNRHPVHERLGVQFPEDNRRLKISGSKNRQGKRFADQDWVYYKEHEEEKGPQECMVEGIVVPTTTDKEPKKKSTTFEEQGIGTRSC
jgi:hypothetical protein